MSALLEELKQEFSDEEARYAYVDAFLNASVAAQIKTFRGDLSQHELAEKIGTKQSGISRLENVNYSAWKVETLRKLARAFGLRLRISFEEFGTLATEIETFRRGMLRRRKFANDPIFNPAVRANVKNTEAAIDTLTVGNSNYRPLTIFHPLIQPGSLFAFSRSALEAGGDNAEVVDAPQTQLRIRQEGRLQIVSRKANARETRLKRRGRHARYGR